MARSRGLGVLHPRGDSVGSRSVHERLATVIRTEIRTARKVHGCDGCVEVISPGDRYVHHIASPNHGELGNLGWWRRHECRDCAVRYGRMVAS